MMRNKFRIIGDLFPIILIIIASILLSFSLYIRNYFSDQTVEQMIFYLLNGVGGTSINVIISALGKILFPFIFMLVLLYLPILRLKKP